MIWREERGGKTRRRAFGAFCRVCRAWFPARVGQRRRGFDFCCSKRCANTLNGPASPTYQLIKARKGTGNGTSYRSGKNQKLEHQNIMEKKIGRPLQPGEVVHHINGDKGDNQLMNLRLMSASDHTKLHVGF